MKSLYAVIKPLARRNSCLYLLMRALRRAPVFLCKTPLATALSTALVASEINDSKPLTSSSVHEDAAMSSLCLTKTFFMRVVISDLRALLYVRSLRDKRVRASLFCADRTTNAPLAGVAVPAARANDPLRVRVSPSLIPHPSISSIARPRRANARAETDTNGPHAFNSTRIRARLPPFHRPRAPTARHRVHVEPHPRPRRRRAPTNRRRNRPTRARSLRANERTDRGKIHAPLLANGAAFTAWENVNRVEANIVVE